MERVLKYQKIESYMLQELSSGRFGADDRFFSEVDIARQFDVTVITARKAFAQLEKRGYIMRRRGLGTFVKSLPERPQQLKIIKWCIIGIVTGNQGVDNSFKLGCILYELHRAIEEAGYLAMLVGDDLSPLLETGVNGVIVLDRISYVRSRQLFSAGIPVVSIYPENQLMPGISIDYTQGAQTIIGFLKQVGARHLVMAGEGEDALTVRHVFERPLTMSANEAGMKFSVAVPLINTLRDDLIRLLKGKCPPDAILVANSWNLATITSVLRELHLVAGKDISVLVHGSNALMIPSVPAYSIIDIDVPNAVRSAVALLQQQIREPDTEPPAMICRYGEVIDRGSIVHHTNKPINICEKK